MILKFSIFTFLVVAGVASTKSEEHKYTGFALWPRQTHMLQMKELKATFSKGSSGSVDTEVEETSSEEMPETQTQISTNSAEVRMRSNRLKRETETAVTGNANRLQNLINLPVQLNVLANVLSKLNAGVLDAKPTPSASNSISGNNNTVSSLVNVPLNADAVVNILSEVNKGSGAGSGSGPAGLVQGVLGGLLGGAGNSGGLLKGLLEGGDQGGVLGGVLGNTLGDLLSALLGGDGAVGKLLGGQDGKRFVGGLLNNLLAGVLQLVDNLLQLLLGLLDGLLPGVTGKEAGSPLSAAGNQSEAAPNLNMPGNNNEIHSLVNAPIRLNELIKVLSSLKQQLQQAMDPSAPSGPDNASSGLLRNLLESFSAADSSAKASAVTRASAASSSGLLSSVLGSSGGSGTATGSTSVQGNNNSVSSLLNVAPDVKLNLSVLSQVTDLLKGGGNSAGSASGNSPGSNSSEICFDVPIKQAETSITGNNNQISNAINVKPKINLDLNLLSSVSQSGQSSGPTQRICITMPQKSDTVGASTTSTTMAPVTLPPKPPKPTLQPITPLLPSPSGEICFYVWVDQSTTAITGNNKPVNSLINLPVNLNMDLNILGQVQQTNADTQRDLVMKRVCIPGAHLPTASPIQTTTERPIDAAIYPRCFKRTCTRWRQSVDYNCANNANEYPRFAVVEDVAP